VLRGRCSPRQASRRRPSRRRQSLEGVLFSKVGCQNPCNFCFCKKASDIYFPIHSLLPSASTAYTAASTVIPSLASQYIAIEAEDGTQSASVSTIYRTVQGRHEEPLLTTRFHTEQTLSLSCMCRHIGHNRLCYLIAS
jgi:hypothetical protein